MVYAEITLRRELEATPSYVPREYAAACQAADEVIAYARSRGFEVAWGRVSAAVGTDLGPDRAAVAQDLGPNRAAVAQDMVQTPTDEKSPGP